MKLEIIHLEEQLIAESALGKTAATVAMILAFAGGGAAIKSMLASKNIDPQTAQVLMDNPEVQQEAERMRAQNQPEVPVQPEPTPEVDNTVSDQEYSDFIEHWEDRKNHVYDDGRGNPTVGVGFNLKRGDAPKLLSISGADFRAVLGGTQDLSDQQIDVLLRHDLAVSRREVKQRFSEFDDYPKEVKLILVDFMFNVGEGTFDEFVNFRAAVSAKDWATAAAELQNSQYYGQTGRRSKHHVDALNSL